MPKKKNTHRQTSSAKRLKLLPAWALAELESALEDFEQGKWVAARETLEDINARCPRRPEILKPLAVIYESHGETALVLRSCRQLSEVMPDEPDVQAMLVHS